MQIQVRVKVCLGVNSRQEDVAFIDSIAKGQLMTPEEEEDVIKIHQADIGRPCTL